MPDVSELKVELRLTVAELRQLVGLINLGTELLEDTDDIPEIVDDVTGLYFELMENLEQGIRDGFAPG
jgi:hypothetical protein